MRLDAGDIVLVPFPFTDLSSHKTRPAMVLTGADYNAASQDIIVCGITSNLANASYSVLIGDKDLETGKLAAASRVKADKVATLKQSILRRRVGRVKATVFAQVMKELESILG